MSSVIRAAALSAAGVVSLVAVSSADAGFVYQSAAREVSVSVSGAVVDSESSAAFGDWFGNASVNTSGYVGLATQGSGLDAMEMSFVGAAQLNASSAANLNARSVATVVFLSDATESLRWIASLAREAVGSNNNASIAFSVTEIDTGAVLLAFSGPSNGSGSFDVVSGRSYRVSISAIANATGATSSLANYNVGVFSTVPGPGAVALLGLAGLAARRRR